jgi:rRNA biogenesis protein RRP5
VLPNLSIVDLKTISKFAQLEYRIGDPERGKTIFEGIVDSHPKRWDLWSIYMDMEAGQGNMDSLRLPIHLPIAPRAFTDRSRHLFDRLFTLKMTSHKAR